MNLFLSLFLLIFSTIDSSLYAQDRRSSEPYISGDTFRVFCKHIYDELDTSLHPHDISDGDTVFVKGDYVDRFIQDIHPYIDVRYILVTHNSDEHIDEKYIEYLNDERIIAWFGQNAIFDHPKLFPIPIGIANRCWPHGNVDEVASAQFAASLMGRDVLAYLNIAVGTYYSERSLVFSLFSDKPYCYASYPKDFFTYLCDLGQSKFVFSPRGNGMDCHRTWESLLMGAIPIIKSSPLDRLYEGLPVLIVSEWSDVDESFLQRKYFEMQVTSHIYDISRAYSSYWLNKIKNSNTN